MWMKKIAASIYWFFIQRKLPDPYFRTIMVLIWFVGCAAMSLLIIVNFFVGKNLVDLGENRLIKSLYILAFGTIVYGILAFLIDQNELKRMKALPRDFKRIRIILPVAMMLSLILIMILAVIFPYR